jgi:hypothetical protein
VGNNVNPAAICENLLGEQLAALNSCESDALCRTSFLNHLPRSAFDFVDPLRASRRSLALAG